MYKLLVLATLVCAANAGFIPGGVTSYASGPALGAPLLGSVSYTAPETTIVKQPITIDQPEIRYRAVPTLVQAPVVRTVVAAPAPIVKTYAAGPPAISYAGPGLAYGNLGYAAPGFAYNNGLAYGNLGYAGGLVL